MVKTEISRTSTTLLPHRIRRTLLILIPLTPLPTLPIRRILPTGRETSQRANPSAKTSKAEVEALTGSWQQQLATTTAAASK